MDIAIIGGGINGASMAYFFAKVGGEDTNVRLYEAGNIAGKRGTTAYSAGILRHYYSTKRHVAIAKRGIELIYDLESRPGRDCGVHSNGHLRLVGASDERQLRHVFELERSAGVDAELVRPSKLSEFVPGIDPDGVSLGLLDHDGGFADPYLVTTALIEAARSRGVEVYTETPVIDLHREGNRITVLETQETSHQVDYVVNAAGSGGADIGEMVGLDLPLSSHESKVVVLGGVPYESEYPTISDHAVRPDMYVKPEPSGAFIVGGIDRPPIDEATGPEGVDNQHLRKVTDQIEKRLPEYADAEVRETWSGVITMTPDEHQIVGAAKTVPNLYHLVGGNGHGFKEALGFAESAVQEILGENPRFDLSPYRPDRFDSGELIPSAEEKTHGYS